MCQNREEADGPGCIKTNFDSSSSSAEDELVVLSYLYHKAKSTRKKRNRRWLGGIFCVVQTRVFLDLQKL